MSQCSTEGVAPGVMGGLEKPAFCQSAPTGKSADPTASIHGNTNDSDEAWNSSLSRRDLTYTLSAREMLG